MKGDRVRITSQGVTVDAVVLFESANGKSLGLAFDDGLPVGDGYYYGFLPVMREDDGGFTDLAGHPVKVERNRDDDPFHYECGCGFEFIGPGRVPITGDPVLCPKCGERPNWRRRA